MVFTFKGQQDPVVIKSNGAYNDGEWHMVELNRDPLLSKLVIDDSDIKDSTQKVTSLDINVPFYVGGVNPNDYNRVHSRLVGTIPHNHKLITSKQC